jgi:hypothetical protein
MRTIQQEKAMSLVTLIQKLEKDARDAVVQIEEWNLPKAAIFTNKLDEAGRKIYSLFTADVEPVVAKTKAEVKADAAAAKAEAAKVEADAKADANAAKAEGESLLDELKTEIKDIESKVEGLFKKAK